MCSSARHCKGADNERQKRCTLAGAQDAVAGTKGMGTKNSEAEQARNGTGKQREHTRKISKPSKTGEKHSRHNNNDSASSVINFDDSILTSVFLLNL